MKTQAPVCVAVDHTYNDNDGARTFAIMWNGEEVYMDCVASAYDNGRFDDARVNATQEEKQAAADWWQANETKVYGSKLIGCTVVLQRSRKAPNKTPLLVVDYDAGGYNARFNQYDPETVCVQHEGANIWVSVGCVKEVVEARAPWWL